MVPFWARTRTPRASMQPSMDKSRESSINRTQPTSMYADIIDSRF